MAKNEIKYLTAIKAEARPKKYCRFKKMGIHYIAAGHHATERYGVQALGLEIASRFAIEQQFIDIPNPV